MPYLYLIQPVELVGTNRYKVGMSSLDNLNRIRSYKNGTRHLFICECDDALYVERQLIEAFKQHYKLIGGREYFEVDCEMKMINLFISIVMKHKNRNNESARTPSTQGYTKMVREDSDDIPIDTRWINKFKYKPLVQESSV